LQKKERMGLEKKGNHGYLFLVKARDKVRRKNITIKANPE
jgi:hypothetical protein